MQMVSASRCFLYFTIFNLIVQLYPPIFPLGDRPMYVENLTVYGEYVGNITYMVFKNLVYFSCLPLDVALQPTTSRVLKTSEERDRCIECYRKMAEDATSARQKAEASTYKVHSV
ncbi:hypothetical protein KIN20_034185 [Parelaphostrongylus tenuis]|uniref:Uncharacterized protein n=1 Tax=Parelaphostrongylus tenuis TaxID=148309 RepID=A0AAD5R9M9_PARTN|nr:hypothetical protein KIN20_034185 [Parelaphostrongylus tenuis]